MQCEKCYRITVFKEGLFCSHKQKMIIKGEEDTNCRRGGEKWIIPSIVVSVCSIEEQ